MRNLKLKLFPAFVCAFLLGAAMLPVVLAAGIWYLAPLAAAPLVVGIAGIPSGNLTIVDNDVPNPGSTRVFVVALTLGYAAVVATAVILGLTR